MQEMNFICRELMSLNIQAVPTQQRGFHWGKLFSMSFVVIETVSIHFQTLKVKLLQRKLLESNSYFNKSDIRQEFQISDTKIIKTHKGKMPLKMQTLNIWERWHSVCVCVCMRTRMHLQLDRLSDLHFKMHIVIHWQFVLFLLTNLICESLK